MRGAIIAVLFLVPPAAAAQSEDHNKHDMAITTIDELDSGR